MGEGSSYDLPLSANVYTKGTPLEGSGGTSLQPGNNMALRSAAGVDYFDVVLPPVTDGRVIIPIAGENAIPAVHLTQDSVIDVQDAAGVPTPNDCQLPLDASALPSGSQITILARNSGKLTVTDAAGTPFYGPGIAETTVLVGAVASFIFDATRKLWLIVE